MSPLSRCPISASAEANGHSPQLSAQPSPGSAAPPPAYPPGLSFLSLALLYLRFRRDLLGFLRGLVEKYGDLVHVKVGTRHFYLVAHPDQVREVVLGTEEEMLRSISRPLKRIMGNGLLSSQGEFHRNQRRLLQPCLSPASISRFAYAMVQCTTEHCERWRPGQTLDIAEEMLRLSLAVAFKTLFGCDLADEAELGRLLNAAIGMTQKKWSFALERRLAKLPFSSHSRSRSIRESLDLILKRIIDQRRDDCEKRDDVLSMLLRLQRSSAAPSLTDEQVRDEALTLLIAGHETVASALTWTWYLLSLYPGAEARLHEEIASVLGDRLPTADDLPSLGYTQMVLTESMRLYPPVWLMVRIALRDLELGGYRIPAGSYLHVSQLLTHRDSRWFDNPDQFEPLRWAPEQAASRHKYSYFPFAAGGRKCIGEGFAWTEGILVLATLAQRWRLKLVEGHPVSAAPFISLRPKHGMLMRAEPRTQSGMGMRVGVSNTRS